MPPTGWPNRKMTMKLPLRLVGTLACIGVCIAAQDEGERPRPAVEEMVPGAAPDPQQEMVQLFQSVERRLKDMGFSLVATGGTAEALNAAGVETELVKKVHEGRPHIVDSMISGNVQLVFNTTEGAKAIADSYELRRSALVRRIPYYTTVAGAKAAVEAISAMRAGGLEVAPLQSYFTVPNLATT